MGVHWKIRLLGGRFTKKQYSGGGELPKKGVLGQFADLRGAEQGRGDVVLERGLIPQWTLWVIPKSFDACLNST